MTERTANKWRALLWAGLGYLGLTILLTWPATGDLGQAVAGLKGRDSLQYTWSLWWSRHAWQSGHSPAQVTLLYYPWGGEHLLLDVTPMLDWIAFGLYDFFSPTQVYNILFLSSFPLCGLAMYCLASDLTGHPLASFLAGAVYAFFPNRMGHALSGHLTQLAGWWFPLYVRYLLSTLKAPSWRNALLGGMFLALSLYVALIQTAYFVAPVTFLVLLYFLIVRRGRFPGRSYRALAVLFGLAAILVLPKYGPFVWRAWQQNLDLSAVDGASVSVDLLSFVLPSPFHPLWGGLLARASVVRGLFPESNDLERIAFLGWIPLLLSSRAVVSRRTPSKLWVFVGLAAACLSLGPVLFVGGKATGLPLPYALLAKLPFYRWGRTPERFNALAMFCMSLLSAQGLASLPWGRIPSLAVIGAVLLEMVVLWPFPPGTSKPPDLLELWRLDPEGAVLSVPMDKRQIGNLAMYYQTTHEHPIVGGYIHRDLPGMRRYVQLIDDVLADQAEHAERSPTDPERWGLLAGLDVRRVFLHREFVNEDWFAGVATRLRGAFGPPSADVGSALVFDVAPFLLEDAVLANFGDSIGLMGVQVEPPEVKPGGLVTITCYWHTRIQPDADYTVFIHLLGDDGERLAQDDGWPLGGNWPTSLCAPSQTLLDQHALRLPEAVSSGSYDLGVGWYLLSSGKRLPVESPVLASRDDLIVLPAAVRVGED